MTQDALRADLYDAIESVLASDHNCRCDMENLRRLWLRDRAALAATPESDPATPQVTPLDIEGWTMTTPRYDRAVPAEAEEARWPTLDELRRMSPAEANAFFASVGCHWRVRPADASGGGEGLDVERPALNFDDYRHNAELDALCADPDPETNEGQRLWRFFREGVLHPTALGIRDFGQRVCQIEAESRYPGPNRDPLGIWRGKCGHVWDRRDEDTDVCSRCAATPPAPTPASEDGLREAAIEWVAAERAYRAALASHKDWTDEQKQGEMERDPEAWFGPSDRAMAAQRALIAAVDRLATTERPAEPEDKP